jgi:hypothetical protein
MGIVREKKEKEMRKRKKIRVRLLVGIVALAMLMPYFAAMDTYAEPQPINNEAEVAQTANTSTESEEEKIYKLWYNAPAPNTHENVVGNLVGSWNDDGWQNWSMPLGNGFFGANVWGRFDTERINIAETSIQNRQSAGLSTLMNIFMDFNHTGVTNYYRDLVLNDAIANVRYTSQGVDFAREYFTSHPDRVMVIRLTASEAASISFDLRPIIPFVRSTIFNGYDHSLHGVMGKTAQVTADLDTQTITLAGEMLAWGLEYEAQVRVINTGGTVTKDSWHFNPGTAIDRGQTVHLGDAYDAELLRITNADEVVILVSVATSYPIFPDNVGTDYPVFPDPGVFTRPVEQALRGSQYLVDPHERASEYMEAAANLGFAQLRARHLEDYQEFFSRATIDLGGRDPDERTTVQRINAYRDVNAPFDPYLEELFFQFGRYLLIASSREGGWPAHLQGIWNAYEIAPWSGGYWHNINLQMNYWPAFNTNLAEMFASYADYNMAFREAARINANNYLRNQPVNTPLRGPDGLNGWAIGTGTWPYRASAPDALSHSGPGTGGMTTSLFWEYFDFTRDLDILLDVTFPAISEMANFLSKTLMRMECDLDGDDTDFEYLVRHSASPEQINPRTGQPGQPHYYRTIGAAFDQQMVYDTYRDTLEGIRVLEAALADGRISAEDVSGLLGFDEDLFARAFENYANFEYMGDDVFTSFYDLLSSQLPHLDPVIVGMSGQVKEYREENFYSDIGDPTHRHISHLIGLYPGDVLNSTTPHWFDAARVTLNGRGDGGTGWAIGHKLNFWARMADGNRSYTLLRSLLSDGIYDNLKGRHAPFQIDANFGGTAGMAEMLINSHEGFINLLPSRPDQWATGSFRGLTARGNFEVDASWTNHQADSFTIRSGLGYPVSLQFFNISQATVTDALGALVSFTADGEDRITFSTLAGGEYTITNIPNHTRVTPPVDLEIRADSRDVELTWGPSEDAVSYNVYVAEDSEPGYNLLANVGMDTYFTVNRDLVYADGFEFSDSSNQFTFRVTAVAANGRESDGITRVLIPPLAPQAVEGIFFDSEGELMLEVRITPAIGDMGSAFKLFEKVSEDEYIEIEISNFPLIYARDVYEGNEYYVAAYNAFSGESQKVPVVIVESPEPIENVFLRRPITLDSYSAVGDTIGMGPGNLVDGLRNTRFALNDGVLRGGVQVEIDLEGEFQLAELRIFEFHELNNTRSPYTVMDVFFDGEWSNVFRGRALANPNRPSGQTVSDTIDLIEDYGNVFAQRVRFTFINAADGVYPTTFPRGPGFTAFELEATSAVPPLVDKSALLAVIQAADLIDSQRGFGINWPAEKLTEYLDAKDAAMAALLSDVADQARVQTATNNLQSILDEADGLSRAALPDLIEQAVTYIEGLSGQQRQVAEFIIGTHLDAAKVVADDIDTAALVNVHLALYRLFNAMNQSVAEIDVRVALNDLIEEAQAFLEAIDINNPLFIQELYDAIVDALQHAGEIANAEDPLSAIQAVRFATNRLQESMDAFNEAMDAMISISPSGDWIHHGDLTVTINSTNAQITDFFYTIDGSDPTTSDRRAEGNLITAGEGFYNLRVAGFIDGTIATNIAEEIFFITSSENASLQGTATASSDHSHIVPGHTPGAAADGNRGSRWGTDEGPGSWLQIATDVEVTVGAIIIHSFTEPQAPSRLGSAFTLQYFDDELEEWVTIHTGDGAQAPDNGLNLRRHAQRQEYALMLDVPVTASIFRIHNLGGSASIWEFELYTTTRRPDELPNAEITLSSSADYIGHEEETITIISDDARVTEFFYTLDGSEPTPESYAADGNLIILGEGFHTLRVAGFIDGEPASNIAEEVFFITGGDNVAPDGEASARSTLIQIPFGADSINDRNLSSRWAAHYSDTTPQYVQIELEEVASIRSIVIHSFIDNIDAGHRLGTAFQVQYLDSEGEWVSIHTGNGGNQPENGINIRPGNQRQVYAIMLEEAVSARIFRINYLPAISASLWEFELFGDIEEGPTTCKDALREAVDEAMLLTNANFSAANWRLFVPARNHAQNVLANEDATQEEIDTATNTLWNMINRAINRQ